MAISRNQEHFIAMTVIYNELNDFYNGNGQVFRDASSLIASLCELPYEACPAYITNVVKASLDNYGEITKVFIPKLKNWEWKRIPLLTQSILLMSYAHYYMIEKVDKRIVINTAVKLAKTYIDEKQAKFINALLDEVLK